MEFDARARLHHNKKKHKQQPPISHGGLHSSYHDYPPAKEQESQHTLTDVSDVTTIGYVPYRDQDEVTDSSSSDGDDSDSDSNIPSATHTLHDSTEHSRGQEKLLNLDSPPANTTAHSGSWMNTALPTATTDDLAAVFGNPSASGVRTANLLDITVERRSNNTKLAPPTQTDLSASSSIEDLLFGGDNASSSSSMFQQQRPTSAGSGDLFGNTLLQPQSTGYREPTVIGNVTTQMSSNLPMGVATQSLHPTSSNNSRVAQKNSSATSLTKDDPFAQFVNLQTSSLPSSQGSTPGSSPWPGTSPRPGGSPRSGGSPIPPGTNLTGPANNPPRYGMSAGVQPQVMGSQYSQTHKNKSHSSGTTQPGAGGVKKPPAKKPQATGYSSVIGGREERGLRRTTNPTGEDCYLATFYCPLFYMCVGLRPKLNADHFQDLLGAEGFNVHPKNKEPQTLSNMQDIGDLMKEQDPDRAKVKLLSSLVKETFPQGSAC